LYVECGGEYHSASGSITYPVQLNAVYSHNMDCAYIIHVNADKVVNMTFTQFNLEAASNCQYDTLRVRYLILITCDMHC